MDKDNFMHGIIMTASFIDENNKNSKYLFRLLNLLFFSTS